MSYVDYMFNTKYYDFFFLMNKQMWYFQESHVMLICEKDE